MSRNLVICCDGTNNQFGPENTNVVRLVEVLVQDSEQQLVFYDAGVGTMPEPGLFTKIGKTVSMWFGLGLGTGLMRNVEEAYTFLMQNWEPGDRVFLFGFSRGAYTVRVLAALLHQLGLLPRDSHNLLPYATKLFKASRRDKKKKSRIPARDDDRWTYWRLCNAFRYAFARPVPSDPADIEDERKRRDQRHFPVHFLGVWDTVSSVGWVWEPVSFPFTAENPSIRIARHAISIDERRWFFRQNRFLPLKKGQQDLKQHWFPGVHADVGGGYPLKQGGLWRMPFEWMLNEAAQHHLLVDSHRLHEVLSQPPVPERPWAEHQHESLRGAWWIAEYVPKWRWDKDQKRTRLMLGWGKRHRRLDNGELIDRAALLRIRETGYSPPSFSTKFVATVRALADVPPALPYKDQG
jgi:uncharacterized protein (DUF2235 family)